MSIGADRTAARRTAPSPEPTGPGRAAAPLPSTTPPSTQSAPQPVDGWVPEDRAPSAAENNFMSFALFGFLILFGVGCLIVF